MGVNRLLGTIFMCAQLCSSFLFASGSLYNSSDSLYIVDHSNFTSTILGTENAWIIEFYNSWCGHCIHFAPTWKEFAKDILEWDHTIKVAVIDCAVDKNTEICRDYEVMGYPTMKMFTAHLTKGDTGKIMRAHEVDNIRNLVLEFLTEQQAAKNGSAAWPNLQPYKGSIDNIWKNVKTDVKHIVLVMEEPSSRLGRAAVLDFDKYPKVLVRYMNPGADMIKDVSPGSLPVVKFFDRTGKHETISGKVKSRQDLFDLVTKTLKLTKSMSKKKVPKSKIIEVVKGEDQEGGGDGKPEEINSDKLNYQDDLPDTAFSSGEPDDQVYMVDIENAISYVLNHEVAMVKHISEEKLDALIDFLNALINGLPMRPPLHNFIKELHDYLAGRKTRTIFGAEFSEAVKFLQSSSSVLPSHQPWIGCNGSSEKYRGYPCGLWTTFHTLTVNSMDGPRLLPAIHGYIKNFFSCTHCSNHFQKMYKEDNGATTVNIPDDAVMWLWRAHNKVNKRIKGSESEDPKYPKVQFPSSKNCPKCWNINSGLNDDEVLSYLKRTYAKGAISFRGTESILPPVNNRQSRVLDTINNKRKAEALIGVDENAKGPSKFPREQKNVDAQLLKGATWGFNDTDISLCVLLYGLSTIIIITVYCMVVIRRKMRRKKFLENHKLP